VIRFVKQVANLNSAIKKLVIKEIIYVLKKIINVNNNVKYKSNVTKNAHNYMVTVFKLNTLVIYSIHANQLVTFVNLNVLKKVIKITRFIFAKKKNAHINVFIAKINAVLFIMIMILKLKQYISIKKYNNKSIRKYHIKYIKKKLIFIYVIVSISVKKYVHKKEFASQNIGTILESGKTLKVSFCINIVSKFKIGNNVK
jgi:hypothetical protein